MQFFVCNWNNINYSSPYKLLLLKINIVLRISAVKNITDVIDGINVIMIFEGNSVTSLYICNVFQQYLYEILGDDYTLRIKMNNILCVCESDSSPNIPTFRFYFGRVMPSDVMYCIHIICIYTKFSLDKSFFDFLRFHRAVRGIYISVFLSERKNLPIRALLKSFGKFPSANLPLKFRVLS